MGKKKKRESKPKQRNTKLIDERLKKLQQVEPPEKNPYKMDNEGKIEQFLKFGSRKPLRKFSRLSIKEQKKWSKRSHRVGDPMRRKK